MLSSNVSSITIFQEVGLIIEKTIVLNTSKTQTSSKIFDFPLCQSIDTNRVVVLKLKSDKDFDSYSFPDNSTIRITTAANATSAIIDCRTMSFKFDLIDNIVSLLKSNTIKTLWNVLELN